MRQMEPFGNPPCFGQLLYPPLHAQARRANHTDILRILYPRSGRPCRGGLKMMALQRPALLGARRVAAPHRPARRTAVRARAVSAERRRGEARGQGREGARELPSQPISGTGQRLPEAVAGLATSWGLGHLSCTESIRPVRLPPCSAVAFATSMLTLALLLVFQQLCINLRKIICGAAPPPPSCPQVR